jgi:hypothetical protein
METRGFEITSGPPGCGIPSGAIGNGTAAFHRLSIQRLEFQAVAYPDAIAAATAYPAGSQEHQQHVVFAQTLLT